MPSFRRAHVPGGTFFFTLVTEGRAPLFVGANSRELLHQAIDVCRQCRPFQLDAIVLLPDHLHVMVTLETGDSDFSSRLSMIKAAFTRSYLASGGAEQTRSPSRVSKRRRGVWQRWFWEHTIRDERDRNAHLDYIHFNPVKHGLVTCPHDWPYSSFARYVGSGHYDRSWLCSCAGERPKIPLFENLPLGHME